MDAILLPGTADRAGEDAWRALLRAGGVTPLPPGETAEASLVLLHGAGPGEKSEAARAAAAEAGLPLVLLEPEAGPPPGEDPAWDRLLAGAARLITTSTAVASGLVPRVAEARRVVRLLPFLDASRITAAAHLRPRHRSELANRLRLDPALPWLLLPAEEPPESHRRLARALSRLVPLPWTAILFGPAGAVKGATEAFSRLVAPRLRVLPLEPDRVPALLVTGALLVTPAEGRAALDLLLPSMAAEVPVVASRSPGTLERVQDGLTGRLGAPGNPESLANAAGFLLRHEDFRRTFARQAREASLANHDLPPVARALRGLLEDARA